MKNIYKYPAIIALMLPAPAIAECTPDGLSFEFGLGLHPEGADEPEFTMDNPLGIVAARYTKGPIVISVEHTSGINDLEDGYGANIMSIRYRISPF